MAEAGETVEDDHDFRDGFPEAYLCSTNALNYLTSSGGNVPEGCGPPTRTMEEMEASSVSSVTSLGDINLFTEGFVKKKSLTSILGMKPWEKVYLLLKLNTDILAWYDSLRQRSKQERNYEGALILRRIVKCEASSKSPSRFNVFYEKDPETVTVFHFDAGDTLNATTW